MVGVVGPITRAALSGTVGQSITSSIIQSLSFGDHGDAVIALQQFLATQGFYTYGTNTGYFGTITRDAVIAFQRAHGIDPVGSVGPITSAAIASLSAASSTTSTTVVTTNDTDTTSTTETVPRRHHSGGGGGTTGTTTPPADPTDTTAPLSSAISSGTPAQTSATITWTTDESADSQIEYGMTVSYTASTTLDTTLTTSHTVSLTGLTASTTYHYRVRSADAAGNSAYSSDQVFTTASAPVLDTTPPVRSAAAPSGTLACGTTNTTLSLTTDETATCAYSATPGTAFGSMTTFATTGSTAHAQPVSGLTNGSSYTYYIKCRDSVGNTNSFDYTISFTIAADTNSPAVSMTAPGNNAVVSGSTVTLSATASDDHDTPVVQFVLDGTNFGSAVSSAPYTVNWNSTGSSDGSHTIVAIAHDTSGKVATSSVVTVTVDNSGPVLSSISSGTPGSTSTTLTWTTDESADSQVEYGTSASYTATTTLDTTLATSHTVSLTSLSPSTTYHFRVRSSDAQSNLGVSTDYSLLTTADAPSDTTAPVITAIASSTATSTLTISWTTDEAADSQIEYGTTASYTATTTLDTALVMSHSVTITGLTPDTAYHFRIRSKDAAANLATSTDRTVSTLAVLSLDSRFVILGNSIDALGTSRSPRYWTQEQTNSSLYIGAAGNLSHGGDTLQDAISRDAAAIAQNPAAVQIMTATNDFSQGGSLATVEGRLDTLVSDLFANPQLNTYLSLLRQCSTVPQHRRWMPITRTYSARLQQIRASRLWTLHPSIMP